MPGESPGAALGQSWSTPSTALDLEAVQPCPRNGCGMQVAGAVPVFCGNRSLRCVADEALKPVRGRRAIQRASAVTGETNPPDRVLRLQRPTAPVPREHVVCGKSLRV